MRIFGKATVATVEAHMKFPRDKWDGGAALKDDDIVTFFLEEPSGGESFLYHAFVDTEDPPVFFGEPSEVDSSWHDESSIQLYFNATPAEFVSPGFLRRYFAD